MSKEIQIKEALENSEANIAYLASLPDSELAEKLDTVHIQMQVAEQKKNTDGLHLLEIWRNQIINARIHKAENNIPDTPNEIDLVIADIEMQNAKAEERQEILKEETKPAEPSVPKVQQQADDSQLTLF